jgi:hypothetical protein
VGAAALERLRPPGLIEFDLLDHVDRVGEHFDVAHVIEMRMRGDDDLHLIDAVAQFLELLVDHLGAGLIGCQEAAKSLGPMARAIAVGDRDVVARVIHHQPLRVVDDPHGDRDVDVAGVRIGRDQPLDVERAELAARGPVQFLRGRRRRHAGYAQRGE